MYEYTNVVNQVSSKATVFDHKYFGAGHTFIISYIYIMLKQKVANTVTVIMGKTIYQKLCQFNFNKF